MSREFDFIDLYYLNDATEQAHGSSEISLEEDIASMNIPRELIEISDLSEESVTYTYAKFFEILDEQGLEGLVHP